MRKKAFLIVIISTLILGMMAFKATNAAQNTRIYIISAETGSKTLYAKPSEKFTVNVNIALAKDLFAWGMRIKWNPAVLNLTKAVEGPFLSSSAPEGTFFLKVTNQTAGFVDVASSIVGAYLGVDGNGTLLKLTFQVIADGQTLIDNEKYDQFGNVISPILKDHFLRAITDVTFEPADFNNLVTHDIAVTEVQASPTFIPISEIGRQVSINVTVKNNGEFSEKFNVTVTYITTFYENRPFLRRFEEQPIEVSPDVSTDAAESKTISFIWNTTEVSGGDHRIRAVASFVGGEAQIANNALIGSTVRIAKHDVIVSSINAAPQNVTPGDKVTLEITATNIGDFTESFGVSTYYDNNFIGKETVTDLAPGANKTVTLQWDTTGVDAGGYIVEAVADSVPGETFTEDNSLKLNWDKSVQVQVSETVFPTELAIGGAVAAIVVVLVLVYYLMRRRTPKSA